MSPTSAPLPDVVAPEPCHLHPVATGVVVRVTRPGIQTTVQDAHGRLGYWMVGVPPSGAMDSLSMELANRIVGNLPDAAGLECTVQGPALTFDGPAVVAFGGAVMDVTVDGYPVPFWHPIEVGAGAVVDIGSVQGAGMRAYVAVRGGFDVPAVLGSRATFTLGGFGGHDGRELRTGDELSVGDAVGERVPFPLRTQAIPVIDRTWTLDVTEGPHAAPEFFTEDGIHELLAARWQVQSHAARTGVRLSGPTPAWARTDGGEAGLHPSNIHDTGYAFGAVDFTGDTPVVLGPDGPSLGGFTCPFTVVSTDRWKLGQLAPGDDVSFRLVSLDGVAAGRADRRSTVARLRAESNRPPGVSTPGLDGGVLAVFPATDRRPEAVIRRAGDEFVLVELGDMTLDLRLRAQVHLLEQWLAEHAADAFVDLTAGIRSLLVHVDPDRLPTGALLGLLGEALDALPDPTELVIPGRTVHLPLSWEDPSTLEAIARYMQVVRDDAPWCPSNIEFIRRVNGLDDVEDVRRTVHDARYLVLGLGDVYLGAPVATPLDPRHRLVTTKYNPARTWTPQNAVGIGGAYLCIYGMEGPGGYQFVGRTVPVWYLGTPTPGPEPEVPWLLRAFDQIRFHPVTTDELAELRTRAVEGTLDIEIERTDFSLAAYEADLAADADDIAAFRIRQRTAFDAERDRWRATGEL